MSGEQTVAVRRRSKREVAFVAVSLLICLGAFVSIILSADPTQPPPKRLRGGMVLAATTNASATFYVGDRPPAQGSVFFPWSQLESDSSSIPISLKQSPVAEPPVTAEQLCGAGAKMVRSNLTGTSSAGGNKFRMWNVYLERSDGSIDYVALLETRWPSEETAFVIPIRARIKEKGKNHLAASGHSVSTTRHAFHSDVNLHWTFAESTLPSVAIKDGKPKTMWTPQD